MILHEKGFGVEFWMAPNGCKKKMIQEMRKSAVEWGAKIRRG
jgi:hypothetical protein